MDNEIILFEDFNILADIYESRLLESAYECEKIKATHMYRKTQDPDILLESMADSNNMIVAAIGRIIEKIKEFFNKFIMYFNSYALEMDKFTKKYSKELKAITGVEFSIQGYNFTVLNSKGPNMRPFQEVIDTYNELITKASTIDIATISKESDDYFSEQNLAKLRSTISGLPESVTEEDFTSEVRKYYRGGDVDTKEIAVSDSMYQDILANATKLVKAKNDSIKDRDDLLFMLNKTKQFFETKVPVMYAKNHNTIRTSKVNITDNKMKSEYTNDDVAFSEDLYKKIDRLVSFKYHQVTKLSGMINLVASERANALKDQVKQEYTIVRRCLFGKTKDVMDNYMLEANKSSRFVLEGTLEV